MHDPFKASLKTCFIFFRPRSFRNIYTTSIYTRWNNRIFEHNSNACLPDMVIGKKWKKSKSTNYEDYIIMTTRGKWPRIFSAMFFSVGESTRQVTKNCTRIKGPFTHGPHTLHIYWRGHLYMDRSQTRLNRSQTRLDRSQTRLDRSQTRLDRSQFEFKRSHSDVFWLRFDLRSIG